MTLLSAEKAPAFCQAYAALLPYALLDEDTANVRRRFGIDTATGSIMVS